VEEMREQETCGSRADNPHLHAQGLSPWVWHHGFRGARREW
jgi:hypothetical protein